MELYKHHCYLEPVQIIQFTVHHSAEKVFQAWTDEKLLGAWFKPKDFKNVYCTVDPEEGGGFKVGMQAPDGKFHPLKGEYLLLEEPNVLIYMDSWDDNRENNEVVVNELRFQDSNDACIIELYSSFPNEEKKTEALNKKSIAGWQHFFENLQVVLDSQK